MNDERVLILKILTFFSGIFTLILGVTVFLKNIEGRINQVYFVFSISVSFDSLNFSF